MTVPEKISAVLGCLGFLLSLGNVAYTIKHNRPRLRFWPGEAALFCTKIETDMPFDGVDERQATLVSIALGISNDSARGNSVVSVTCGSSYPLLPLAPEARYVTGQREVNLEHIFGFPRTLRQGLYWSVPQDQWTTMTPLPLAPGDHKNGNLSFEVQEFPLSKGTRCQINITVKDSFGREYVKSLLLTASQTDVNA